MKHEYTLEPLNRFDIQATGQYIGYVSGPGELELNIDGEHHYLNVNEVLEVRETFSSFSVRNMTNTTGEIVIKTGMGKLYMSGDGQLVDILRVRETVKTDVQNASEINAPIVTALAQTLTANITNTGDISNPIVAALAQTLTANITNTGDISNPIVAALAQTLTANITNTGDISNPIVTALAQTLTANITNTGDISNPIVAALAQTLETVDKPTTSIEESEKIFSAGESFTIAANADRRDITIFAAEENVNVVTVSGVPLRAGQYVTLNNYVGSIETQAIESNEKIKLIEVIK